MRNREKYPANWKAISREVRTQAGWCCEQCGAKHDNYIIRDASNPANYTVLDPNDGMGCEVVALEGKPTRVIITVHHKGIAKPDGTPGDREDKADCRPENLIALCQRCHLQADEDIRIAKTAQTKARHRRDALRHAGQIELFAELS